MTAALRARSYDCVVVGAGLRKPRERLLLFEKVLNLIHRLAPNAAISFNTTPADTTEAAALGRALTRTLTRLAPLLSPATRSWPRRSAKPWDPGDITWR